MRSLILFGSALATFTAMLLSSSVQAAPITLIDGTIQQYTLQEGVGGDGFSELSFVGGQTGQFNGGLVGPYPTILSTLLVSQTGVPVFGGTQYQVIAPLGADKTINGLAPAGTGSATFDFGSLTLFVPAASPHFMLINGLEQLLGSVGTEDFSPFLSPFSTIAFSLNAVMGTNFNTIIQGGLTQLGSGSFSEQAVAAPVPEPSSLLVWGCVLATGWIASRRFRQAKA